ncbi:unnamed protein product [Rotaria sordida]|uniref:Uncharacterized protein n=1 Tax=Rotaria sordida TaxID=392033 RepID=A0A814BBT8_9BILA|nr:unnamed protein product [Rotaria sordida]CAF1106415.1 unnamed protein product [Rotaria sordida]
MTENDNKMSSLITQIQEQLKYIRQDNIELTKQLTNVYNDLCHIRQSLICTQSNSNLNTTSLIETSTSNRYHSKQRSDSEPNILSDRQRILTIINDLQ